MWRSYYATADLREEINTDLERLYIDGTASEEHFQDAARRQRMLHALRRVGPHAPGDLVPPGHARAARDHRARARGRGRAAAARARRRARAGARRARGALFAAGDAGRALEADAFLLFEALLDGGVDGHYEQPPMDAPPTVKAPIVAVCARVQHERLGAADRALGAHVRGFGDEVSPQLYGMKWLRLLFLREFDHPESTMVAWDALFACASALPRAGAPSAAAPPRAPSTAASPRRRSTSRSP